MSINKDNFIQYNDDRISFKSSKALQMKSIYFPLAGISSSNIKSSITPGLSGDIKVDKYRYVTKPVSCEDLRQDLRNVFCSINGQDVVSIADDVLEEDASVEMGPLWHKVTKRFEQHNFTIESLNFVPVNGDNVEIMKVTIRNDSNESIKVVPTVSIPLFARSLANKQDHEHVTSLLNRIVQTEDGVVVEPTMNFNEEGHIENHNIYYVLGQDANGKKPRGSFPTFDSFLGDEGTISMPQAVYSLADPETLSDEQLQGKEAMGALQFESVDLAPKEEKVYMVLIGIALNNEELQRVRINFASLDDVLKALDENKKYWLDKATTIEFHAADENFNSWMHWVTIQPVLRRIFGCSFLPDHDYGKGGKGWRDIWQDLLSLILIEPKSIGERITNYFAGVRIDGTNATIIGSQPGEFIADRNDISRVWMDHGVWPLHTLALYINQTGDLDVLLSTNTYFKDAQLSRAQKKDMQWQRNDGNTLKTSNNENYQGTILEHLLVQQLVPFYNVGEHNIIRLEGADWNDGLDMAADRGESVAFTCAYAGNLKTLVKLLETLKERKGIDKIVLADELTILFQTHDFNDVNAKLGILQKYFESVQPTVSGKQSEVDIDDLIRVLTEKVAWLTQHVRNQEKVTIDDNGQTYTWINGYYDNQGSQVEGKKDDNVWMMLTSGVFAIMSGLADEQECEDIIKAYDKFLRDESLGGYRLNTNFKVRNYLDFGRAFSFAYGTKENGAFFSHMTVMYAYALYSRGYVGEGNAVLSSIYKMCQDVEKSKIYPGIPEYFDSQGRGRYHYLTGSASWLVLTELTQVFGIRGLNGDLCISPKLVASQFDDQQSAIVKFHFASKDITVKYNNPNSLDFGNYGIKRVSCDDKEVKFNQVSATEITIDRAIVDALPEASQLTIELNN